MKQALLEYQKVNICYSGTRVVQDVDLQMKPGEILGIVGESGSGKTTLIKSALGILGTEGQVESGRILFRGEELKTLSKERLRQVRGSGMGMIFQNPGASLCPVRKIGTQFLETMKEHKTLNKKDAKYEILEHFEKMNLRDGERILNSYPFELSGGMNQRVAIALAMILRPSLILADEPTSALDVTVQAQVVKELMEMRDIFGTGILMVTHNIGVAAHMADRIIVMRDGKIIESGSKDEVIYHPRNGYTRKLIEATPKIRSKRRRPDEAGFRGNRIDQGIFEPKAVV